VEARRVISVLGILALLLVAMSGLVVAQQQVSVEARVKPILTIDGLQFKDLNGNGVLDPYEDWRLPVDQRVKDLISQMTLEEKVGLMFHINTGGTFTPEYPYTEKTLEVMRDYVLVQHINHVLDNNNGTPDYLATFHNVLQEIAEGSRLGIPIIFSSDRASNTWGGMIDFPHAAFGTNRDLNLTSKLFDIYAKEMRAIGYHLTLHPSGVEVFRTAWGEDHEWVAQVIEAYVRAYTANGVQTCLKHFPANGFAAAESPAALVANFLVPWAAGFEAGAGWIMFTQQRGISRAPSQAHYDEATLVMLRKTLGFDGIALTDWFPAGSRATGITADGVDIGALSLAERYARMVNLGVDQFGGENTAPGTDKSNLGMATNYPDALLEAVQTGLITEERIDESAYRILKNKFELGLFDDPYVDPETALQIAASVAYIAERWEISGTDTLLPARNPRTLALDHALQAAATILLKNDGILPLEDGIKVYVVTATVEATAREAAAISAYATVVDNPADADVGFVRMTVGGRGATPMALLETVTSTGLPTVVALDLTSAADISAIVGAENVAAVLMMTYTVGTDHGSPMGGVFLGNTLPNVLAAMLFGRAEPSGKLAYELPRSAAQANEDWNDVPFDLGATTAERMLIASRINAGEPAPINLGDPLFMYSYGMGYGLDPRFVYSMLVVPKQVKPDEAFNVSCLLSNDGFDGYTTAELYVDDALVGSKFMAIVGGQNRVVEFDQDVILNKVGVHTIKIGPLSASVEVVAP